MEIKKLQINYEIRYKYSPLLTGFINTFPQEHRKVRVDNVVGSDGESYEDWVRIIRDVQIGNLLVFLIDNGIEFKLENITSLELQEIKREYHERQERIKRALKLKEESLDVTNEDYSFMKLPPYEYQKRAVKFFEINNGVSILGDSPGVGKSNSSIAYATKHQKKALVICPSSLKFMWRDEVAKFTKEKAHILRYWPTKISKNINHPKDESLFHVINYEGLAAFIGLEYKHACEGQRMDPNTKSFKRCGTEIINLKKTHKECPNCGGTKFKSRIHGLQYFKTKEGELLDPDDYDLVIVDEFHRMKNPKTDWTQIIKRALSVIPEKLLLSGTAIKNRPMELFVPLNFLDPKTWNDRHAFGIRFCAAYEDHFGWIYDGVSNTEELYNRIAPMYLRRLKKDVLPELPDKTYTEIRLELESSELKEFTKLESAMKKVANESELINQDGMKEVPKTFMEKIHQIKLLTESIKLDRAAEFIQDIIEAKDKVVLFFDYLPTAQRIKDMFGDKAVIHTGSMNQSEKHESVTRFQNDKKVNVFGGTIMSAGVGITLTAANKLIFLGQAWSPSDMIQAEDRIHRASTTHDNVQIITYLCNDTWDNDIYEFLRKKDQVVSKVLDNVDSNKKVTSYDGNFAHILYNKLKG